MQWFKIDDNQFTVTHSMVIPGGTLYRTSSPDGVAMCFVPLAQTPFFYNAPFNPNDHVVTCGPATSVAG